MPHYFLLNHCSVNRIKCITISVMAVTTSACYTRCVPGHPSFRQTDAWKQNGIEASAPGVWDPDEKESPRRPRPGLARLVRSGDRFPGPSSDHDDDAREISVCWLGETVNVSIHSRPFIFTPPPVYDTWTPGDLWRKRQKVAGLGIWKLRSCASALDTPPC